LGFEVFFELKRDAEAFRRLVLNTWRLDETAVSLVFDDGVACSGLCSILEAHYHPEDTESPEASVSEATDAQARQDAPHVLGCPDGGHLETVHIVFKRIETYKNCVVMGTALLNQQSDGDNDDGIPSCHFRLAPDGKVALLFRTEAARRAHATTLQGTEFESQRLQVKMGEAEYSVEVWVLRPPSTVPPSLRGLFQEACNQRESLVLPLWVRKSHDEGLRLKRYSWFFTEAVRQGWKSEVLNIFRALKEGDRLCVVFDDVATGQRDLEWTGSMSRWEGQVAMIQYDQEPDKLFPLPNVMYPIKKLSLEEDTQMGTMG